MAFKILETDPMVIILDRWFTFFFFTFPPLFFLLCLLCFPTSFHFNSIPVLFEHNRLHFRIVCAIVRNGPVGTAGAWLLTVSAPVRERPIAAAPSDRRRQHRAIVGPAPAAHHGPD